MVDQHKIDELQKCIESPYYFFMSFTVGNEYPFTKLTEEEFNLIFKQLVNKCKDE